MCGSTRTTSGFGENLARVSSHACIVGNSLWLRNDAQLHPEVANLRQGRRATLFQGDDVARCSSRSLAGKASLQDGLAQASGALEVGDDGGFQFLDHAQAALDLGDDASLFGKRGKRNWDTA